MPLHALTSPQRVNGLRRQRGAATLLVVMVLFFILAMVTAYAGRNLIFEQRTSVNNQRATQALEAAEAGLDYAIGRLGSGRVNAQCVPLPATDPNLLTQSTFRERYFSIGGGDGRVTMTGAQTLLRPTCMLLADGPTCSCPKAGENPSLIEPVGLAPTFQLTFSVPGTQEGLVRVDSLGCSSIGTECYTGTPKADAVAKVSVLLGLHSALAKPPAAPLMARGNINAAPGTLTVVNTDEPTRGITIHAGGDVPQNLRLSGLPGTPGEGSVIRSDTALRDLGADGMFASLFGIDRTLYGSQPAVVHITCGSDCAVDIGGAAAANPGSIVWVQGPVQISSNIDQLGTATTPLVLVVEGHLTVAANVTLHGLLYLRHPTQTTTTWTTTVGTTTIHGAVVAESGLSVVGSPTVVYDPNVLRTISLTQGSWVRVPGSWRDFAAGS